MHLEKSRWFSDCFRVSFWLSFERFLSIFVTVSAFSLKTFVVATTLKVLSLSLKFEKDCQSIVLVKLDCFAILKFILKFERLSGEK